MYPISKNSIKRVNLNYYKSKKIKKQNNNGALIIINSINIAELMNKLYLYNLLYSAAP